MDSIDFALIEATFRRAASAAATKTLPLFRTELLVDNKVATGFDPVTEADRGAEAAIRAVIAEEFPDHAIFGEEYGPSGESRFSWIIDPVDGTRAFIFGIPVWGTLIGFCIEGRAVAGVMSQPFNREIFLGFPGSSTYERAGHTIPLRSSGRTSLASARVTTTTPALFERTGQRAQFAAVEAACLQVRYGLDCYGYSLLAAGQVDLVIEVGLQSYDIAALIPIIRGAGGVISTLDGGAPDQGGSVVAAATPELLAEAMVVFNGAA